MKKFFPQIPFLIIFSIVFNLLATPFIAYAWDLSSASYDSVSFAYEGGNGSGINFNSDGTKMFVGERNTNKLYRYSLSSAWDLSTASYDTDNTLNVGGQAADPYGFAFKSDGTAVYIVDTTTIVYQYTLSSAWDLTSGSYAEKSYSLDNIVNGSEATTGIAFNSDGSKMYVSEYYTKAIYQYTLSTPWDVSSATYDEKSLSIASQSGSVYGVAFQSDGERLYTIGAQNNKVYQYNLSSAWDLSSGSYSGNSVDTEADPSGGLAFKTDGSKMYLVGISTTNVYQYTLTNDLTPDVTDPELGDSSPLSPADNSTDVSVSGNLVITFNENMAKGTGNILIKSGESTVETIDVTSDQVTVSGATVTINPSSNLSYETSYYVQVASTALDDTSGNSYAGISDSTTWNFTTEAQDPWLSSGGTNRKAITLTGQSGAGTDFQIKLAVGESSGSGGADFHLEGNSADFPAEKNDGGDLRFADND
ncbi:Ig-like domain-containing protein, partial [Patescibacteria group bacterium]|nr:Ig-like domain-containing protein [Patescibacteria group bacterium]